MAIDFFVHPEFKKELFLNNENYKAYERGLISILEASELPILITNGQDNQYLKKFPEKNILYSMRKSHESLSGELDKNAWESLSNITKGKEKQEIKEEFQRQFLLQQFLLFQLFHHQSLVFLQH